MPAEVSYLSGSMKIEFSGGWMKERFLCHDGNLEVIRFKGYSSNMFLLIYKKENKTLLVDCGLPADIPNLIEFMNSENIPPVEKVICTHFHVDHCSGWIELMKVFENAEIFFHEKARKIVTGVENMDFPALSDFTDVMIPAMKESGYVPSFKEVMTNIYYGTTFKSRFPMDKVRFFDSEDEVIPGFQTIFTPGHRPEETSFYEPGSGILISGDFIIVVNRKILVNTYVYSQDAQKESLEKVKKLDNLMTLLPGHGDCVDFNELTLRYKPK